MIVVISTNNPYLFNYILSTVNHIQNKAKQIVTSSLKEYIFSIEMLSNLHSNNHSQISGILACVISYPQTNLYFAINKLVFEAKRPVVTSHGLLFHKQTIITLYCTVSVSHFGEV